jgi:cytochrome P450
LTLGTPTSLEYTRRAHAPQDTARRTPGPDLGWPAQLRLVRRDFLGYLRQCSETYGDLFAIRPAPGTRIWVVNCAELTQEVLVDRASAFRKSSQTRLMVGKFLGNGLVLSEGSEHQEQKRRLMPAFGPKAIAAMCQTAARSAARWSETTAGEKAVDVEPAMTKLALGNITSFLLGELATAGSGALDGEAEDAFREFAAAIGGRFKSLPLPAWIPTPRNLRERRAISRVDQLVNAIVASAGSAEAASGPAERGQTVLATLVAALRTGTATTQEARDHIVTLLFAGHETVAKAMTWTLQLLALHPEVQRRVQDELDQTTGDRLPGPADLPRLRYLACVIKETMRLYPPAWVFDRGPLQATTLGGQTLRPKDIVYLAPFLLHRQERYFPEPLRFYPERFAGGLEARLPPGAYLPFGAGPRVCIGQSLAFMETMAITAALMATTEVRATAPVAPDPRPDATLSPSTPVELTFTTRRPCVKSGRD